MPTAGRECESRRPLPMVDFDTADTIWPLPEQSFGIGPVV